MLYTVVVVTFNAEKYIDETLQSLLAQQCENYEVVVIDGASKDLTVKKILDKKKEFENKNIPFQIVSESDDGIYNAMNKGIKLSKGEYIYFLNAGDVIYDESVFEKLQTIIKNNIKDVYYGDTLCINDFFYKIFEALPIEKISEDFPFCHQSVIVKRELMLKYGFDEKYKICADYDFFVKIYMCGAQFEYVNFIFSKYRMNGFSSCDDGRQFWVERIDIRSKWFGWDEKKKKNELRHAMNDIRKQKLARMLKQMLPKKLLYYFRVWHGKKEGWFEVKID